MKKRILLNFLYEEKLKSTYFEGVVLIPVIMFIVIVGINGNLKYKNFKLEKYIESNYEYTTVSNLDYNIDKSLIPISNIIEITKLISDKNINYIKINNNRLNLLGYSHDSNSIKTYSDRLSKNNKINNISIESINKEGDTYSFEIEADVGSFNEI